MTETIGEIDELEAVYGEDYVDVTDDVQCYERGKTFSCECGQGIGTVFDKASVQCASCGRNCVDTKPGSREPPKREEGQASLSQWA